MFDEHARYAGPHSETIESILANVDAHPAARIFGAEEYLFIPGSNFSQLKEIDKRASQLIEITAYSDPSEFRFTRLNGLMWQLVKDAGKPDNTDRYTETNDKVQIGRVDFTEKVGNNAVSHWMYRPDEDGVLLLPIGMGLNPDGTQRAGEKHPTPHVRAITFRVMPNEYMSIHYADGRNKPDMDEWNSAADHARDSERSQLIELKRSATDQEP